jgi:ElaB/YqjD/DUF883 family membrane-anchored ribosome-binding protein
MEQIDGDRVVENLRELASRTEALVAATAGQGGERIQELRMRAEDALREARLRMLEAGVRMEGRVRHGARAVDDYVHDRPWRSLGIAAGAAFLIGYILGRR